MDISAVRAGLAANAATISGLRTSAFVPDAIDPPVFVVGEVDIDFDTAFARGLDDFTIRCRLYVSKQSERSGQAKLNAYMAGSGSSSLKAALESDRTLGGACEELRVVKITGYGQYEFAGTIFYGIQIEVRVWGRG